MTGDDHAMLTAWVAYFDAQPRFDAVGDACRAYHQHMIAATPGLCFHETDGTVRQETGRDI